jgi:hypothetical protein
MAKIESRARRSTTVDLAQVPSEVDSTIFYSRSE